MDNKTKKTLESVKKHFTSQAESMSRMEKEAFYDALNDWTYRQYSKVYIDGLDEDTEEQYYAEV